MADLKCDAKKKPQATFITGTRTSRTEINGNLARFTIRKLGSNNNNNPAIIAMASIS